MRRPELYLACTLATALLCSAPGPAGAQDELQVDDWYRTEVLIFIRQDEESLAAEAWEPEPQLAYPPGYRHLLDPALAERRFLESGAYESRLNAMGHQFLRVPAAVEELLDHTRPDAMTQAPDIPLSPYDSLDPNTPADPNAPFDPNGALDPDGAADDPNAPDLLPGGELDPNDPLAAGAPAFREVLPIIPYRLRDREELEFVNQARSLRRRGHRVAFHGSWWAPLDDRPAMQPIVIDRGADPDVTDWPALQGSLVVYRSRYLHIDLNLWLNTAGDYLPEAWQIEAPPLPSITISAETLRGEAIDPWAPLMPEASEPLPVDVSVTDNGTPVIAESQETTDTIEALEAPTYPWRHAIVHRQSRRMRSGEIHYLDHPVIGVIVKITPTSEELLPYLEAVDDEEMAFRERHQLPVEFLRLPVEDAEAE